MIRLHYFEEQVRDHLIRDGFLLFLRMYEFLYFHTFIYLILLTFETSTPLSSKEDKKSYIQIIDRQGFGTHYRNGRKGFEGL
jgi:hypothetical protein